ncbi:MAG: hypothetical protein H6996_09325 [Moraxellaceae bacterium]|nr:hypothetical protein [Pseudomonadales bacterium]MCB1673269.1 hypothetical protein [Pseudomonadales bacterium]MCP5175290.1 hypothetical protein [Moraxellaceae bacterium]MCP5177009.1 hypothetical protein [Moraxellaceae bacterium]
MKYKVILSGVLLWLVSGCSSVLESKAQQFGQNFSQAVLENNDPVLVEQALPSYLLLLDALLKNQSQNMALLKAAAKLNSAYASAFVSDTGRGKGLNDKALDYAAKALCLKNKNLCQLQTLPIDEMAFRLTQVSKVELDSLYVLGSVWAGWIQVHSDDWNAIADLARVKMIMQRVLALDENYQQGEAHLYLGVLATLLSPALGGQPEVGKSHFEKALVLSEGKNLIAKVYYAKFYARNTFNRELHDALLQEVVAANPQAEKLTLSNLLAQQQAKTLLASADDYF